MKRIITPTITLFITILLLSPLTITATTTTQHNTSTKIITTPTPLQGNQKIETILNQIDENLLETCLTPLVDYAPRWTGTYGCEQSAQYIHNYFQQQGLQAHYQNWTALGNEYHRRLFTSQNVIGTLPGTNTTSNKIIIFNAHYDTVRLTPGANDDGSGTAAVLAAAYALSQFEFEHTIKLIGFSGEEVGLLGSHAYAQEAYHHNDDIIVALNADMIGHATTKEGGNNMALTYTEDAQYIYNIAQNLKDTHHINIQLNPGQINRDSRGWSDYHSFLEYGYETIGFWGGEHDPYMHTPLDDLNNVNFTYLVKTTKIIVSLLAYLADAHEFYPQVRIVSPQMEALYHEGRKLTPLIRDLHTIVIDDMWIWADIKYQLDPIVRAEFYFDDKHIK